MRGAHRRVGPDDDLVPLAADALEVSVLAAGGITDGCGLAAALALGAEGVVIGIRLMLTDECLIRPNLKQALVAAAETDTRPVLESLRTSLPDCLGEILMFVSPLLTVIIVSWNVSITFERSLTTT